MPLVYLEPVPPRATKSQILAFLHEKSGIALTRIGKIDLGAGQISIEVPEGWQDRVARALDGERLGGKTIRAWAIGAASQDAPSADHFNRLLKLLDLEAAAELEQVRSRIGRLSPSEAERTGDSLVDLAIDDVYGGLGGRFVVTLVKRNRSLGLPWTRLNIGSPVLMAPHGADSQVSLRGVVSERSPRWIRVAINELAEALDEYSVWRIDLTSDEVTRQRQRSALLQVRGAERGRLAELRSVMQGETAAKFSAPEPIRFLNTSLNASQQAAVEFALSAQDVAIIHGPPGTGKTTTVVELVRQAIARGERVLVCAPSNLAVDNMLERLVAAGEAAVRLGHPARVLPVLREHTLDLLVEKHEDVKLAQKFVRKAVELQRKAGRFTRAKLARGAKNDMRDQARELIADARKLEQQAVERILDRATVVCATTTGLHADLLGARQFDLAVIDEAGQSTEPPCWIPLLRSTRLVLAGDHWQLPPTILSAEAAAAGLAISLLERLALRDGEALSRRLIVQYRMHAAIMGFSSQEFYDDQLVADPSVAAHLLCELDGVERNALTEAPLEFIDTAGGSYDECQEPDGESRFNEREALLVCKKVGQLIAAGVPAESIAVIAPYAAQVRLIRQQLDAPGVEIDSVDGFQGREKEAVVVSLVRSNSAGEIGFLADTRRMNVALTRARRKLLVIGDSATLASEPFYQHLLEYFEHCGAYRTVWEED